MAGSDGPHARRRQQKSGASGMKRLKRGWLRNGNRPGDWHTAPRCGAETRRSTSCRNPAMRNGRCRMHGGRSTGPRTATGLRRSREARLAHGRYSDVAKRERQKAWAIRRELEATLYGSSIPCCCDAVGSSRALFDRAVDHVANLLVRQGRVRCFDHSPKSCLRYHGWPPLPAVVMNSDLTLGL